MISDAKKKNFVCTICGEEVSKRKSYAVDKDGNRACRIHQESQDASKKLQDEVKAKQKAQERRKRNKYKHRDEDVKMTEAKCWVCRKAGIDQRSFFYRVLLAMHKAEVLKGKPYDPFSEEGLEVIRKYIKSPLAVDDREVVCLFVVPCKPEHAIFKHLDWHGQQAASCAGFASICGSCAKKYNVELPIDKLKPVNLDELPRKLRMFASRDELAKQFKNT